MSKQLDAFFKSYSDSEEHLDYKMANETIGEKTPVISTGSVALDDALSSGGLPKGRLIQYYGAAGCHALGQLIMMADGSSKKVEDIEIGDKLMGNGDFKTVLELKRGFGKLFNISPIKGNPFIVNEDHILTLVKNNKYYKKNIDNYIHYELIDISVKEYLTWSDNFKKGHKLVRGAVNEFENCSNNLDIDPYMLGVLLGDGSLMRGIELTSADPEVVQSFKDMCNDFKLRFVQKPHNNTGKAETYRASNELRGGQNDLFNIIKKMNLNIKSENKFIPDEYKTSSISNRALILAGLIDTDGHLSNGCIDYISKSKQLSEDVCFIARSIGLAAYITVCEKSAHANHIGTYYRVGISGNIDIIPTRIARKMPSPRKQIKNVRYTGFNVEPCGEGNFYGFTLNGDGRYLLDDFTITHNSGKTLMTMIAMVEAQRQDPTAQQVFIDAEQTFDPNWAETLGVDTSRVIHIEGDTAANGRKCFELLLGIPKEDAKHVLKGKSKEGLLDKIANGDFNINLIILDSLGSIVAPIEDVSIVGKSNMATMARFLTSTFKKLTLEVSKAKVPFIIINHKRDNMDPYGSDHTYAGGNTYSHTLSANVYFEAVQRKDAMILDEKENKVGHPLRATIEKSKFGPWPRKCEFKVNFGVGIIDRHEEIAQLALDYNVVTKPTNVSHEYMDRKWVGFPKFCEAIKDDPNLAAEFLVKISEAREAKMQQKRDDQAAKRALLEGPVETSPESKKAKKIKDV